MSQTFSATYGLRVIPHDMCEWTRSTCPVNTGNFIREVGLRKHIAWLITDRLSEFERRARSLRGHIEELELAREASARMTGALTTMPYGNRPQFWLYEDTNDFGTVRATLHIAVTHAANRPFKIHKEVLACTPS